MIEGSGSGPILLTNGSGFGRPKNMCIRWIRIRNTGGGGGVVYRPKGSYSCLYNCTCVCMNISWRVLWKTPDAAAVARGRKTLSPLGACANDRPCGKSPASALLAADRASPLTPRSMLLPEPKMVVCERTSSLPLPPLTPPRRDQPVKNWLRLWRLSLRPACKF